MASQYSNKDIQDILSFYKALFRGLEKVEEKEGEYRKDLFYLSSSLDREETFSKLAESGLEGEPVDWGSPSLSDLLIALGKSEASWDCLHSSKALLSSYGSHMEELLASLRRTSNGLKRLFASKKTKEEAEKAYEELLSLKKGTFCLSASSLVQKMDSLEGLKAQEAFDGFAKDKARYQETLKRANPSLFLPDNELPKISLLEDFFKQDKDSLKEAIDALNAEKGQVKDALNRYCAAELVALLKGIPVDNIAKEASRVKIKCLRDAGYLTYADIYASHVDEIASAYGVSRDAAYTVKRIVKKHVDEAKENIRIRLSIDSKTKESTALVKAIAHYLRMGEIPSRIEGLKKSDLATLPPLFKGLSSLGGGAKWLFLEGEERERYGKFYSVLQATLNHLEKETASILSSLSVDSLSGEEAWGDFQKEPVRFFNLIEELRPGVLGNADSLYGLPEDLAREIQGECYFPDGLLCTLRRYQEWGVKYILHQGKVLLGDEMGLGKTVQAIAAMVSLRNTGATHFMVVCPASVLTNWCREIAKHSKLRFIKIHGSGRESAFKTWRRIGGVAVTNYESLSKLELEEGFSFAMLVADEAHYAKNPESKRSQNLRRFASYADRLLFMTGTALENNVEEMISLIDMLNPEIASSIAPLAFMSSAPAFRERIAPVYYRRKREDVLTELPDKVEMEEWCSLGSEERREYEETVLHSHYMTVRRLSWNVDDLSKSSKANRLKEIVEEATGEGRKILVFSFFLDNLYKIHDFLPNRCLNPITGSVDSKRRQEIIDEFEEASPGTVLLAQISSGGTGLNIQAASVVIICEPQLKPSIENQAISRAYRMGQTRKVLVYRLLAEDTIDERIVEILKDKQAIFDAYADKSVASERCEIDEKGMGDIIKEEIERIKKKREAEGEEIPEEAEEDPSSLNVE